MFNFSRQKVSLPEPDQCLPGRSLPMRLAAPHFVNGRPLRGPYPHGSRTLVVGLGCFWGAERKFWSLPGVWVTAVGYAGGTTPNPTYHEVCSGRTAHAEVVLIVYDPAVITDTALLKVFWESHDPTQGMRQGNDVGTQYRSVVYTETVEQKQNAVAMRTFYQQRLTAAGRGTISTEIADAGEFYFAEEDHQQYLAKNPNGYCGLGGTGVSCPIDGGSA